MIFSWLEEVVAHRGGALAVVQRDTYLSFRGLLHRANRRANELRAFGIGEGDTLGIMLGNMSDYVVLSVATNQLGATLVPVPPLCSGPELDALQGLIPLRAIITRPGAKVLDRGESVRAAHSPAPTGKTRLQGSLLSCARFPRPERAATDAPVVFVTPVAGGGYQRVELTEEQLATAAENLALWLSITDADRIGLSVPLSQPFGFLLGITMTLGYGAQLHLDDDLSARRTLQRIRDSELTRVAVSRAMLRTSCTLPAAHPLKGDDVRLLCTEGAVGRELAQAFYKVYKTRPQGGYHRLDTGLVALDADGKSPHTIGSPVKGMQVRIVDPKGKAVSGSKRGRLLVRGTGVTPIPHPEAPTPKGWCDTGERATTCVASRDSSCPCRRSATPCSSTTPWKTRGSRWAPRAAAPPPERTSPWWPRSSPARK
jgi:long-chain acyl-CoA synthetase